MSCSKYNKVNNNFKFYLVHIISILIVIIMVSILNDSYLPQNKGFVRVPRLYYVLIYLYQIFLGVLIGLPKFINIVKLERRLKIDLCKLLTVGIPSLMLSTVIWFEILPLSDILFSILSKSNILFFRILLGYTIISSFYGIDE